MHSVIVALLVLLVLLMPFGIPNFSPPCLEKPCFCIFPSHIHFASNMWVCIRFLLRRSGCLFLLILLVFSIVIRMHLFTKYCWVRNTNVTWHHLSICVPQLEDLSCKGKETGYHYILKEKREMIWKKICKGGVREEYKQSVKDVYVTLSYCRRNLVFFLLLCHAM